MYRPSEKKLVKQAKQQYLVHMSSQYGELRPTNGWDRLASLGHPSKFERVSRLGSVTARHSSSGRQPKFAAFNIGRRIHSDGRPSRWALAHILVCQVLWTIRFLSDSLYTVLLPSEDATASITPDRGNGLTYLAGCVCVCLSVWRWCIVTEHLNGSSWFLVWGLPPIAIGQLLCIGRARILPQGKKTFRGGGVLDWENVWLPPCPRSSIRAVAGLLWNKLQT